MNCGLRFDLTVQNKTGAFWGSTWDTEVKQAGLRRDFWHGQISPKQAGLHGTDARGVGG